ncbi:MAG: hypothetical protein ACI8W8_000655 [Rhodothermales bacterium]|jgi:hypothetical protein
MKTLAITFALLSTTLFAANTLIFEDEFSRNESQEKKDEIGNGWGSNSKKRAAGNKQVDLRDGAMHIYIHEAADHAVSVTHEAEFRDGVVEIRFKLEHAQDKLGLNFADLKFKEVHAGHLFKVTVGTTNVQIADLKTGVMASAIRKAKLAKTLSAAQKAELKTKAKTQKNALKLGTWYALRVEIKGSKLSASIDDKPVLSFNSPGIAHPTKRMLRLNVPRQVVVDDLKIYASK